MEKRKQVLDRLRELRMHHTAATGGPGEPLGWIQDEQSTRKSYILVVENALRDRILTKEDLERAGLPENLVE